LIQNAEEQGNGHDRRGLRNGPAGEWYAPSLNRQGHNFTFTHVPKDAYATLFPGAAEIAETFGYFQGRTYLGSNSHGQIALANKIAGGSQTKFSTWAWVNMPNSKRREHS
jgi:hypothetical protein